MYNALVKGETAQKRSKRILAELQEKYPEAQNYDLDGAGTHFVSELEPTKDHPEYDRAVEVIIRSKPHKHLKTKQRYMVFEGTLELHVGKEVLSLTPGDVYTIEPGLVHWARSDNECWLEIYSEPGWTKEDHIPVEE